MKAKALLGLLFIAFLATIGLTACSDDEDGNWDAMEWTPDMGKDKGIHVISVPVEGGNYEFICKNCSSYWFVTYSINDEIKHWINGEIKDEDDWFNIKEEWFTASVKENVLDVKILPNDNGKARSFQLDVSPGDVFEYFVFEQKGQ